MKKYIRSVAILPTDEPHDTQISLARDKELPPYWQRHLSDSGYSSVVSELADNPNATADTLQHIIDKYGDNTEIMFSIMYNDMCPPDIARQVKQILRDKGCFFTNIQIQLTHTNNGRYHSSLGFSWNDVDRDINSVLSKAGYYCKNSIQVDHDLTICNDDCSYTHTYFINVNTDIEIPKADEGRVSKMLISVLKRYGLQVDADHIKYTEDW